MKTDRKTKAEKNLPKIKAVKGSQRVVAPETSGNNLLSAYQGLPMGVVESSLKGKYIGVNEEFSRILGYSKSELLRRGIKDCTFEDDYTIEKDLYKQLVAGEIPFYRLEKRYVRKDGSTVWVELTRTLVCDAEDKPLYTLGVVLNISERKQAEHSARESQQLLAATYKHAPIGIVEADVDGRHINVNEEFCNILGYDRAELLQKGIKDFTHEDDLSIDVKMHQQLVAGKIPYYRLEKRYLRKQGGNIWVELTRSLVRDSQGKPLYTIGAVLDISDRKHVERVLRDSVERLRLATSAARIFMWEWNLQTGVYTADENFEKVLGFSAGLLPKGAVEDVQALMVPEDQNALGEAITKAIESRADLRNLQVRLINHQNGQIVWVELSGKILYDEEGNAVRVLGVTQNITENKNVQDQITVISRMPEENPNPVMRLMPDGNVLYANGPSQAMLTAWTLEGQSVPDALQKSVEEAFSSGIKKEIEIEQGGKTFSCTLAPISEAGYVNLYGTDITGRKQAQEELRESEERFRAIVSQATAGIVESNIDSQVTFVNPTFCEMLGYSESELLGKTIWELTYTDDLTENKRLFQRMLSQGEAYQFEKRFIRRDGSTIWTNVSVSAIRDLEGNAKGGVGVIIDIDERKQAEQALRELARQQKALYQLADQLHRTGSLEDVYRAALDAILDALQCDRASILLYDNSNRMRFVAWHGLSEEYRKATDGHSPWTPDTKDPTPISMDNVRTADLDEALRAVIQREGIGSLTFIPLVSNGKLIGKFMVYFNTPHAFSESELDLSLTIAYQLAFGVERRRSEDALARERELLERLFETMPVMVSMYDPETSSVRLNAEFERRIGWKTEDVNVVSLLESIYPDPDYRSQVIQRMAAAGRNDWVDVQVQTRDGRTLDSIWSNISILNGRQIGIVIDITERKRMEEALRIENERFMRFVDSNIVGMLIGNASGDVILANDYYLNLLGVSRQDLMEKRVDWKQFTPPEWLPADEKAIQELRERGVCEPYEKEYLHTDGTRVPVYIANALLPGPGEEIAAFVIDISERKRAEEALRRNEELFSTLIQTAPFGVYFIDSEFRLRAVNKGSEAVFRGIDPLIGHDFSEILRIVWQEPFATEAIERFRHTLHTGESFISPPAIEPRANIEEIQSYDWQIHRITMPDGTYGVVCYFYDLSEQKRMEAAVRASEALYRALARNIPGGGVYVVDQDFRYVVAEGPVTESFGLTRDVLEGYTVSEVFPDERGKRMEERLQRNFAGETVSFETQHNGRAYWTQQAPLHDSIGQAIILTIDITERKQAEEARRESEERFRAILRQATAGIVRKDEEGRLIFVNEAFCNMLGYTEAELLGKPIWELMHEDDIEENRRLYNRMMIEGIPFKLESRLIREDGSTIWMDASVSPIMDVEGKPQSAVAVEVDITGRKQAEEALQQLNLQLEERVLSRTAKLRSVNQALREEITERKRVEEALRQSEAAARSNEQKLSTLFDLLPVGISFLDPEGQIIQMNSALLDILKLSKEQLLNKSYRERKYIRPDGTAMPQAEFASARALAEGKTVHNVETGILLESGEVIWTNVSAAPVDVADVGAVVVTVDITDSKRAEQALKESHRRLRMLSQRLVEVQEDERRALARELHDRVGQTLAALNINLIIINSQLSSESAKQMGTRMNDSMKLVAETIALVRDVMTDLRPAVLDDYGLEAALESHIAQFMARYDINVKLIKPEQSIPRLGPSIEMTCLRIAQESLMNIARHAQATQVNVSLRQEEDAVYMTIQDNGIGIESWQQANRPGSHGLTIMRERAEAFNGDLRVRSVPGKGTKVELSIPLRGQNQIREEK